MRLYLFCIGVLCVSLCSCKKDIDENTGSHLPYFHFTCNVNGEQIEINQYSIGKKKTNDLSNSMGNVFFYSPSYYLDEEEMKMGRGISVPDNSLTMFEFGFEHEPKWAWLIDSYFVQNNYKYFYDAELLKKHAFHISDNCFMAYQTGVSMFDSIVWGWMSFTRNIDNPDVILRVEFEADFIRNNEGEIETIKYREGRLDFTTRMSGKIVGGERLR